METEGSKSPPPPQSQILSTSDRRWDKFMPTWAPLTQASSCFPWLFLLAAKSQQTVLEEKRSSADSGCKFNSRARVCEWVHTAELQECLGDLNRHFWDTFAQYRHVRWEKYQIKACYWRWWNSLHRQHPQRQTLPPALVGLEIGVCRTVFLDVAEVFPSSWTDLSSCAAGGGSPCPLLDLPALIKHIESTGNI